MWESDCPFQVVKDRYTDSLALIRDHLEFLTKDDRDWLLFRTAQRDTIQAVDVSCPWSVVGSRRCSRRSRLAVRLARIARNETTTDHGPRTDHGRT